MTGPAVNQISKPAGLADTTAMSTHLPARRPSTLPSPGPDFSRAQAALARATKLADVVNIRDQAEAMRVVCSKAKAGLAMQNQAAEIRLRAERKAGTMLLEQKGRFKSKGGRPPKNSSHDGRSFRSYADMLKALPLPPSTAHRFEHDSQIPDVFFERHIRTVTAHLGGELTTNGLRREWGIQKARVRTNVETQAGSRDPRDVKRENTSWLDTYSVAAHADPAFLQKMEELRAHFGTKGLTATVKALVDFALKAIRDDHSR